MTYEEQLAEVKTLLMDNVLKVDVEKIEAKSKFALESMIGITKTKDIAIDDSIEEPTPQIQIDIKNDLYKSFAVFYGLKDSKINYSSIFELKDEYIDDDLEVTRSKYRELKTIFDEDKGIFCDLMLGDNDYSLHLFGEVDIDNLTEELIDEIEEFVEYADLVEWCVDETEGSENYTKEEFIHKLLRIYRIPQVVTGPIGDEVYELFILCAR